MSYSIVDFVSNANFVPCNQVPITPKFFPNFFRHFGIFKNITINFLGMFFLSCIFFQSSNLIYIFVFWLGNILRGSPFLKRVLIEWYTEQSAKNKDIDMKRKFNNKSLKVEILKKTTFMPFSVHIA